MLEHKCSKLVEKKKKEKAVHFFRLWVMCLGLGYVSLHQSHSLGDLQRHKAEGTSPPDVSRTSHQTGRVTVHDRERLRHTENVAEGSQQAEIFTK